MALYHEGATLLSSVSSSSEQIESLKKRIYASKSKFRSPAPQLYALVSETLKWSPVLNEVIETSGILKIERKLSRDLAALLVHDLLISKRGLPLREGHPLKSAVRRHQTRLKAELTKVRISRGCATLAALQDTIEQETSANGKEDPSNQYSHPRWVRVNPLKSSMERQLRSTFSGYQAVQNLDKVLVRGGSNSRAYYYPDDIVPDLVALPPNTDVARSDAYKKGELIFQDKASCFPVILLDWQGRPADGRVIDAFAAPGNKTTLLAATLKRHQPERCNEKGIAEGKKRPIVAVERSAERSVTLDKMLRHCGAERLVIARLSQDFLALKPTDPDFADVKAILLDPSCSGSGIIGREDESQGAKPGTKQQKHSDRLSTLSNFQLHAIKHAMQFPNAERIVYSTCSVNVEENEAVVAQALLSDPAVTAGWTVLPRREQPEKIMSWPHRGVVGPAFQTWAARLDDCGAQFAEQVLESCVRCVKGSRERTMGFFMAAFIRQSNVRVHERIEGRDETDDIDGDAEDWAEEEEWHGFGDD